MRVVISSWHLEVVGSILLDLFGTSYREVSREGGTMVIQFANDNLKREVDSWVDHALACELIFRGVVTVL